MVITIVNVKKRSKDLVGVLKTVMHYGIVSGYNKEKSLGKYKDQFPQMKDFSLEIPE